MERDLSRMETELYGAEAVITATQLYLERHAGEGDAAGEEAVRTELARHRTQVAEYRAQIEALRVEVASARLQVGVGDDRFERHAALRAEYAELVEREHALGGGDERIEALYRRVSAVERSLDAHDGRLEAAARTRATEMARQVEEESVRIEGYRTALAELEAEAEEVVGAVAYTNFRAVQHRFYDLVLRADVGRVDVTWARREEHRSRVEMLTRERSRDIQALDDEFAEIMDEGGDDDEAGGGTR
jgi:hypothetical protein